MGFYSRYNDVYDKFERLCFTCPYDNTDREGKCTSRGRAYRRSWKITERVRAEREIRNLGWSSRYYYRGHRTDDGEWIYDTSRPRKLITCYQSKGVN